MLNGKYVAYENDTLKPFVEKLLAEHYNVLEALCKSGAQQATKVKGLEVDTSAAEYAHLCCEMIDEICGHIQARKEQFIPYIQKLIEKTEAGHDCTTCSGGCKMGHGVQLLELGRSNEAIKRVLNRMHLASLPLYSQTMFPDEYRVLRNRMALIDMNMTELFFLESTYLVPKMTEAQKAINAGH